MIKKVLRSLLEVRAMSWARVGIFLWEAARERGRLRSVSQTLRLPVLDSDALRRLQALKPDATTAFILGTGASVADLSDKKLDHIQSQFSIGVNQWILHPMVPDVYAYEVDPDVRLLQALDRPEVKEKSPYLLFLKPSRSKDFSNASYLPDFMRERSFLYGRVNIWTRRTTNIARDFRRVTSAISRLRIPDVVLDNGASIARMIVLSALLGFSKIVLVGVDLKNVEYFWHRRPEVLKSLKIEHFGTGQKGETHETLSTLSRPFPIDEYVAEVAGGKENVVKLSVESAHSLLAGKINIWKL